jgi:uncharacterized protein YndB with AHSA1/START domain
MLMRNRWLRKGSDERAGEMGSIEREIQVAASPEVVFEVITSPQHRARRQADPAGGPVRQPDRAVRAGKRVNCVRDIAWAAPS